MKTLKEYLNNPLCRVLENSLRKYGATDAVFNCIKLEFDCKPKMACGIIETIKFWDDGLFTNMKLTDYPFAEVKLDLPDNRDEMNAIDKAVRKYIDEARENGCF